MKRIHFNCQNRVARRSVTHEDPSGWGERWLGRIFSSNLMSGRLEPLPWVCSVVFKENTWEKKFLVKHCGLANQEHWLLAFIKDQCVFKTHRKLAGRYYLHSHMMPTEMFHDIT